MALVALQNANVSDALCISWIIWSITDPEALDAAIRLAGTVRWFEDGLDVEPPYDQIVTTLKGCFDSTGEVYPGSRDRAYHCAQAALWIHVRALFVSVEFSKKFPLPTIDRDAASFDPDLRSLLGLCISEGIPYLFHNLYFTGLQVTPAHYQWISNLLLHLSWAMQGTSDTFEELSFSFLSPTGGTIPLNAVLDRLLTSCIFFGWPVEQGWLKIQDKTYAIPSLCTPFSSHLFFQKSI